MLAGSPGRGLPCCGSHLPSTSELAMGLLAKLKSQAEPAVTTDPSPA